MSRLLALPLLVLALFATACGGDGGGEEGTSSEACPSGSVEIKMADIKFDPQETTVSVGQEVCWINEDAIDHNAVAESGADFKSELYGEGQTFTTTLDRPGTVEYVCTVHPGMTGTLTVER